MGTDGHRCSSRRVDDNLRHELARLDLEDRVHEKVGQHLLTRETAPLTIPVASIERFRSIYLASNALQAILLVFFTGKVIYSTIKVESFPRRRNFIV